MLHFVPSIIKSLYPEYVWNKSRATNQIYLTFDDGPVVGVTDFVLNLLEKKNMKGNFFVVGDNVNKNASLAKEIIDAGHQIGNHTFHHINALKFNASDYLKDIKKCEQVLQDKLNLQTSLFRPPYGRITKQQFSELKYQYQIIMWDVLSRDYDLNLSPKKCLVKTMKYTQNGSIVLFHDQQKTKSMIEKVLEPFLNHIEDSGFETAYL